MARFKDLTGLVQGRLTVISLCEERISGKIAYNCECSCGNKVVKTAGTLQGGTKSCGCLHKENARKALELTRDSHTTHGMTKTPTYVAWRNMKARCDDENHQAYENYGGRGISYCDKWVKFEGFLEDMGVAAEGLTLNRINVNLDYSKENCEWVDNYKQGRDKRKSTQPTSCKYKGVSFITKEGKYKGTLNYKGKTFHLGYSDDPLDLALIYDDKVRELTGSDCGTNKQLGLLDVDSLEELYEIIAPWSSTLPVFELYNEDMNLDEWEPEGYHYSNLGKYMRYKHKTTGQYRRGRVNLLTKEQRSNLLSNIV